MLVIGEHMEVFLPPSLLLLLLAGALVGKGDGVRQSEKVVESVAWWRPISEVANGGFPWERNSSISACNLSIVCVCTTRVVIYCYGSLRQIMIDSYNPLVVND